MKAAYPLVNRIPKKITAPSLHWCELDTRGKKYKLDGSLKQPASAARLIRSFDDKAIVFFPDLREMIGKLIPCLLQYGKLIGAGDVIRSLHYKEDKKTIYLADASLYFHDPSFELIQLLSNNLFEHFQVKLAPTPGNTAMRITRRFIDLKALWGISDTVREISRGSLSGGALHWQVGEYSQAYKYDIKSAYAWAMHEMNFPLQPRVQRGMPNTSADGFMIVAEIDFDTDKTFSPLVIYGSDEEAYHPTRAKNILAALNHLDLQTLTRSGNLQIKRIHNTITWLDGPPVLAPVMDHIEELTNHVQEIKPALKVIRNAVFGKHAEHDEMSALTLQPLDDPVTGEIVDIIEAGKHLYALVREEKYNAAPQHNPLFAGLITAFIRQRVYETIDKDTVYIDTDGFLSTRPREELQTGTKPGDWYQDGTGSAVVLGPRIYGLAGKSKIAGQHEYVSVAQLRQALSKEIEVYESIQASPLTMQGKTESRRALKSIKYPHVEARGSSLFITRSPTIEIKSKLPDFL